MEITNMNELRSAVALLNNSVTNMCNTSNQNEALSYFVNSKDLLIAIYKFNMERLSK